MLAHGVPHRLPLCLGGYADFRTTMTDALLTKARRGRTFSAESPAAGAAIFDARSARRVGRAPRRPGEEGERNAEMGVLSPSRFPRGGVGMHCLFGARRGGEARSFVAIGPAAPPTGRCGRPLTHVKRRGAQFARLNARSSRLWLRGARLRELAIEKAPIAMGVSVTPASCACAQNSRARKIVERQ